MLIRLMSFYISVLHLILVFVLDSSHLLVCWSSPLSVCVHVITSSWCLLLSSPYLGVWSRVLHLILVSGLVCLHLILVFGFVCYTLSWCRVLCVSTLSWCLGLCATPYLGAGSCVSPPYLGAWVCVLHLILVLSSLSYTVLVLFGQTLFFSAPDSTSSFGLVFLLFLSIGGSSSDVVLSVSLCICVCVCILRCYLVSVFLCMYVCVCILRCYFMFSSTLG